MKRFIFAFIAAYVFIFLWGWLLGGVLQDVYTQAPNLWRPKDETKSLFHWIIIGQALIILAFVMIYASGFAGGGVMAGIRLGVLLENCSDRYASGHLRSATASRKVDPLRQRQRADRDGNRGRHCRRNLQTCVCPNALAVEIWQLGVGR